MHSYAFCSSSHGHPLCFCWFWFCHLKVVLGCPSFFRIPHALKHVPISELSQSLEVNKYNARYARSGLTPMVAMMMYLLCQCIFGVPCCIGDIPHIWYTHYHPQVALPSRCHNVFAQDMSVCCSVARRFGDGIPCSDDKRPQSVTERIKWNLIVPWENATVQRV